MLPPVHPAYRPGVCKGSLIHRTVVNLVALLPTIHSGSAPQGLCCKGQHDLQPCVAGD
jgi:hypothetical protein